MVSERELDEQIEGMKLLCRADSGNAARWRELGDLHVQKEQLVDARACYARAAGIEPSARHHHLLGQVWLTQGLPDQAVTALSKAAAMAPGDPSIAGALGLACLAAGDPERAKPLLEWASSVDPGDEEYTMGLAKIAAGEGDFPKAISLAKGLLESGPVDEQSPLLLMADCFIAVGRLDAATTAYSAALELEPGNDRAAAGLASVHQLQGDEAAAASIIERELRRKPDSPHLLTARGNLLFGKQDLAGAAKCYQASIKADPTLATPYGPLGAIRLLEDDLAGAAMSARAGRSHDHGNVPCLLVLAQVAERQEKYGHAVQYCESALKRDPRNYHAHLILARSEIALGQNLAKARLHLSAAEDLAPTEADGRRLRAMVLDLDRLRS